MFISREWDIQVGKKKITCKEDCQATEHLIDVAVSVSHRKKGKEDAFESAAIDETFQVRKDISVFALPDSVYGTRWSGKWPKICRTAQSSMFDTIKNSTKQ